MARTPMSEAEKNERARLRATETKSERFNRVVTPRVVKAAKALALVGQVSGSQYEADTEKIAKIKTFLTQCLNDCISRLEKRKKDKPMFSLD